MPLIYKKKINHSTSVAIWKVTEVESFFIENLPLANDDLQAIRSLKLQKRRLEKLGCRMALAQLLPDQNLPITYTKEGLPMIPACHLSFSHAQNFAAAAISTLPLGLDVETHHNRIANLYPKFMSEEEQNSCNVLDIKDLYYFWCAKEAAYKWFAKGGLDFIDHIQVNKNENKVIIDNKFEKKLFYKELESLSISICH